jgi:hypothetical protein
VLSTCSGTFFLDFALFERNTKLTYDWRTPVADQLGFAS